MGISLPIAVGPFLVRRCACVLFVPLLSLASSSNSSCNFFYHAGHNRSFRYDSWDTEFSLQFLDESILI